MTSHSDSRRKQQVSSSRYLALLSGDIPALCNIRPVKLNLRIYRVHGENRYNAEIQGQRVPINVGPHDLQVLNESIAKAATQSFRNLSSEPKIDPADTTYFLSELAREGHYAFHKVFEDPRAKMAIHQLINANIGMTIDIQSEDFFLPWQLLYDGDPNVIRYENFWGFRYIISRCIIRDMRGQGFPFPLLPVLDVPSVALQTDESLAHVFKEEIPFFEKLHDTGKIRLFKLRSLDAADSNNEKKFFANFCDSTAASISHYACHAHYDDTQPHHSHLLLTDQFPLSIRDIESLDTELAKDCFVFLNACETGLHNPLRTLDFVNAFLRNGAKGVIVTETQISDQFAANFAKRFYRLFLQGREVGACLLKSTQSFLEKDGNPLGLVYAYYGDPSLHVKRLSVKEVIDQAH
jgi:hypothetical protein